MRRQLTFGRGHFGQERTIAKVCFEARISFSLESLSSKRV